jgi:hypothetical protein
MVKRPLRAVPGVAQPSLAAGEPGIPARCSPPNRNWEQGCSPNPQAGKPALQAATLALLALALLITLPAQADVPDYKLGDTALEDIITPAPLNVLNPEATETLKSREAARIPLVFRLNTNAAAEAEAALRASFYSARTNFEDALHRTMKGKPDSERVVGSVLFDQAVMSAKRRSGNFPLLEQLAPVWARNDSDEAMQAVLARQLRELMSRPVMTGRPEGFNSRNSIRLVAVGALDETLTPKQVEQRGRTVRGDQVLRLPDARNQARTNILAQLQIAGGYLASFVQTNTRADTELTRLMRAQRTEGLAVMDNYEAGQTLVRRGQLIDAKTLEALKALREKNAIAALQTKLAVQQAAAQQAIVQQPAVPPAVVLPPPAPREQTYLPWIAAGFGVVLVLLLLILRRVRTSASHPLLPVVARDTANVSEAEIVWRERALSAEARAEQAKHAMKSGFMAWMRERLVQGLFQQRAQLLSSQQKAEVEMNALEQRLEQLQAPLQERIAAYEKRIVELEKDLAVKGEENRELIKAKITLAKQQLTVERERGGGRFGTN